MNQVVTRGSDWRPTEADRHHSLWLGLMVHLQTRLDQLRVMNDSIELSESATARIRGQIKEVKALMALDKPKPPTPLPDD